MDGLDNFTCWVRANTIGTKNVRYYVTSTGALLALSKRQNAFYAINLNYNLTRQCKYRNPHGNYVKAQPFGYLNGLIKRFTITMHQLVAAYFCPKPDLFKTEVDHKDGNNLNNNAANLHWVTSSENKKREYLARAGELKFSPLDKVMWYFGKEPWCFKKKNNNLTI